MVEVADLDGLRFERHGKTIQMSNQRTLQEHRDWLSQFKNQIPALEQSIKEQAATIEQILGSHNSFDLIAHVILTNTIINPDTYKEYAHKGSAASCEYVALLALKQPFVVGNAEAIPSDVIQRLLDAAEAVRVPTMLLEMAHRIDTAGEAHPTLLDDLGFAAKANELIVRSPSYSIHLHEVLSGLFGPFREEVRRVLGFNIDAAVSLSEAVTRLVSERLSTRYSDALEQTSELASAARSRESSYDRGGAFDDWVTELRKQPRKKWDQVLKYVALSWVTFDLGSTFSVSSDELAAFASVDREVTAAYLDSLSTDFGVVAEDYYLPAGPGILQARPFIRHASRYLCPSHGLVDEALRPLFEAALRKNGEKVWQRFVRHRHDFLVDRALSTIRGLFPTAQAATKLKYAVRGPNGEVDGEVDALVQVDSTLLVIEGKAGAFTQPARLGKKNRLERDLRELIGKAFEQGIKVGRYISANDVAEFRTDDPRVVLRIPTSEIQRVVYVSLHLEALGHLTGRLGGEEFRALFGGDSYPWMVNLCDLLVIAECSSPGASFLHYVTRRVRATEQGFVRAADELDYFGFYLRQGLFFEGQSDISPARILTLMSHTTDFDNYYMFRAGLRSKKAPKPTQRMPAVLRRLLVALEKSQFGGYVDVSLALLDYGGKGRKMLAEHLAEVRNRFARDGAVHDFTQVSKGQQPTGFTYFCGADTGTLAKRLPLYCQLKKYQAQATRWYGILDDGRETHNIRMIVCTVGEWTPDARLEEALTLAGLPPMRSIE